ncbi:BTAD domain-containing putative transcriptional regulator [Actinomadura sp. GTD37]|uniref:ATP-binding protein n=1 Tax=Actinomadura sp. GTD37 TaxID=1778030 RepID=UPI0035BEE07A
MVVTDQGSAVAVGGARLRALLIRLALEPGRTVGVDALVQALWPEGGPGVHALQALVSRLRRRLPEGRLRSVSGGYVLDVESVDAPEFERLAGAGGRALRDGDAERAAGLLRAALELWRGDALADAAGAPFADAAAVRLEALRISAVEDRVAAELETGVEPARLVAELEELAALHPLRERPRALLVQALHRGGRSAEALGVFERFRRVLAEELGADPGKELQDAYLAVLRAAPRERTRGNLRVPPTSFVGRESECAWVARALWDGRLVTLVGHGGAGKTRLAAKVGAELAGRFPGGVWLVELAGVDDPAEVPRAVAGVLGLRDGTSRLVEALSADETLIVLDNCEHVVDAAAGLVHDLLGACPSLRVLATSRERLGVDGEALCPVPPLDRPASVRLFADRAAAVRPGYEPDPGVAAEICRRLDGLPLAIELAAARLRSMSAEQLAARLDDRFRVLTGGNKALPRHRTLRAVVAWSWDLLDDAERRFAERLSVFPGTITPETAAEVTGAAEALDVLDSLVDRSLLQAVDGAEPRFRMLETIREYGLERLAGDAGPARDAHLRCFLGLAERAEPRLRRPEQLEWIFRLAAERDNLLAALHHAVDEGDAERAVRMGAALATFWMIQGDHAEAARRLRLALEVPRRAPVPGVAAALGGYVFNTVLSGGAARDDPLIGGLRGPGAPPPAGPADGHPLAALIAPATALLADDPAGGVAAVDRLLPHDDPWTSAALHLTRAMLNGNRGEMGQAAADIVAAQAGFRAAGERAGLALALAFGAETQTVDGHFADAVAALEESIGLLRELGQDAAAGLQRVMLAKARARSGDVRRARDELSAMAAPGAATPSRHLVHVRLALGDLARHAGDAAEAAAHYAAAGRELDRVPSYPQFRSLLEAAHAQLAIGRDDPGEAARRLRKALALAVGAPDMPIAAVAGYAVARLRAAADPRAAAEALGAAAVLRGAPDAFNPDVARPARRLRGELGERAYRDAYERGRGLDVTGALALLDDQLRRR